MVDGQFTTALSALLHYSRDLTRAQDFLMIGPLDDIQREEVYQIIDRVVGVVEAFTPLALDLLKSDKVPMTNMPWNIPGGVHSPEAIPASEYVDREMIHQMTCRDELLDTYSLHMTQTEGAGNTPTQS